MVPAGESQETLDSLALRLRDWLARSSPLVRVEVMVADAPTFDSEFVARLKSFDSPD